MNLSLELDRLGREAAPDVVLEGRRMLHRVSDIVQSDGGLESALVRGEVPQVVSQRGRYPLEEYSCTCGATGRESSCAHVIAVKLRSLQLSHGLDDRRIARWERHVKAFRTLAKAQEELATVWLEATACEDERAATMLVGDVDLAYGGMGIARALVGRASTKQLSAFLLKLVTLRNIDGESRVGPTEIHDAHDLISGLWLPVDRDHPEANFAALLALAGSVRRTATSPAEDPRLEWILTLCCSTLGPILGGGNAHPAAVADVLLRAEFAAPASNYPWIALMLERLGSGSQPVALEMRKLLDRHDYPPGAGMTDDHLHRVRAEIGFAGEGIAGLLPVLEDWPDAPYGEYLFRLPRSWVPLPRVQILESAQRKGRLRWAPGWPQHEPGPSSQRLVRFIHEARPGHPMWADIAIGDVVLDVARLGRTSEATNMLREHVLRDADPAHRHEFLRIWVAAKLGDGAEDSAADLFGPATDDLGELLNAISRIPERYFCYDLSDARQGVGTALLTAILFEDIPPEGHARHLDAPMWASSFISRFPAAADDLIALASIPVDDAIEGLEGAVLDKDLALRVRLVAEQVAESTCTVRGVADAQRVGDGELIEALEHVPDATPLTAALVSLILEGSTRAELESVLSMFVSKAARGDPSENAVALLRRAYGVEPRGADFVAYQLGIALAVLGRAPHNRNRRQ